MRKPEFITFTGCDDKTPIKAMQWLSERYPVEWGILFSTKHQGDGGRYPSLEKVAELLETDMRFSAHLCGGHSRALIENSDDPKLHWLMRPEPGRFRRIQVNTADQVPIGGLTRWAEERRARLILQCRVAFPGDARCDWLFDRSGGTGQLPPAGWPATEAESPLVGYAGGLGPDNVIEQLPLMTQGTPYWIDMESGIRTAERFDLEKCARVCEAVYG